MTNIKLQVNSEVGRLRSIMLHKPQAELDNLVPDNMERLLFDDLPDTQMAGSEYDQYIQILQDQGVEIYFLENLVAEALDADPTGKCREDFILNFLQVHQVTDSAQRNYLVDYFLAIPQSLDLVLQMIKGVRKEDLPADKQALFRLRNGENDFFALDPLPNLYFTRDPFTIIGNTVSINTMYSQARVPEVAFAECIFHYHPAFKDQVVIHQGTGDQGLSHVEGGDILLLNPETVAIGVSQRTHFEAILYLAESLFTRGGTQDLRRVLAFEIPSKRAYMHLDTVFTQLDTDCFVVHPGIEGVLTVHEITYQNGLCQTKEVHGTLEEILCRYTDQDKIRLIKCGGDSPVDAEREQWNDGANTLALAPGEVIVYARNHVTNRLMEAEGIKLHKLGVSELARGRGGPHCMSMPFSRDFI